ncbi:MAG: FtsX-like permease family protein [Chloroflexota bacterium]|nr:FtsX-like permease family protein [Chloroflexota bacterium]
MKRLKFYLKYAWRSVMRGGQRSFFAVLCVAVGVATLVALQSLSYSISDTLTGDTQARTGGDLVASLTLPGGESNATFNTTLRTKLDELKTKGTITDWTPLTTVTPQIVGYFGFPPVFYVVDPAKYPLYGELKILEPSGKSLRELISTPNAVVISRNLWEKQNYHLGQEIEVGAGQGQGGKTTKLKIVGEAATDIPGVIFGPGQFFGFGFTSFETTANFLKEAGLDEALLASDAYFIKSTQPQQAKMALQALSIPAESGSSTVIFDRVQTAADLQAQLARGLDVTELMLSYVGLLSLLIGGIGVINTMLVVIGRRTTEIATVKALGLKTRQTLFIFTLEATILGVMGSILGVILGELLGLGIKGVAEGLFARPLNWGLYFGPMVIGLVIGILTSAVFGFLPSYAASRVRPGVVLRIQSGSLPKIGGWASLLIILLMTFLIGLIAGLLLHDFWIGLVVAYVTLLVSAILVGLMWLVVFLVGKLPAPFGPSLKMALRSFSRHRGRTAATIMVMVVGLFFISFIVIIADSIKVAVRDALDLDLGYNVIAFTPFVVQTEQIKTTLQNEVPGLQKLFVGSSKDALLTAISGRSMAFTSDNQPKPLRTPPSESGRNPALVRTQAEYPSITLSGRAIINGEVPGASGKQTLLAGRNLTAADANSNVILVRQDVVDQYKVKLGDKITLQSTGSGSPLLGSSSSITKTFELEVIGILDRGNSNVDFEGGWIAPIKVVEELGAQYSIYYLLVDRAQMKPALAKVQSTVGLVLDLSDLIDTFSRLLDQFLAFPLLLSLLSLFSGAILIANNVALAMLERRTEIGVLKAIGAKQGRIMRLLLWESGLVGLIGGLIGVGMGVLIALSLNLLTPGGAKAGFTVTWSPLNALLLIALAIGLAMAATIASAWSAVKEKPLIVLRYE